MDTPGFNDPNKKRTDKTILTNILTTIQRDKEIKADGLSALLQCVMIPPSGRISKSAIQIMSKMLQSFTLSYPDSDQQGPKILVLFTNFSRYESMENYEDYDEEDDEEISKTSTSTPRNNPQEKNNVCSLGA